jgi:hypothetical protein
MHSLSVTRKWNLIAAAIAFGMPGAIWAVAAGQDANWDQQNYHIYDAYAFLHNRLDLDAAPAGNQGFFNPLPYLPFYFLITSLPPRLAAMILGGAQASVLALVLHIAQQVIGGVRSAADRWAVLAAIVISMASPVALSEIGTSFVDLTLAVPILAALCLMLPVGSAAGPGRRRLILGALLMGAAGGLKLTNLVFCVGLAVACLLGWSNFRARLSALLSTAIGGLAGFLACAGFWGFRLWRDYGNPAFPYYNNIFRSPDYPPVALYDAQWVSPGVAEKLSYPWQWALGRTPSLEVSFRDTRYLMLIALGAAALLATFLRRRRPHQAAPDPGWRARHRLTGFAGVSFVLWLFQFGYQRYLVPLELLAGPLFLGALVAAAGRGRLALPALIIAGVASATVVAPDWGHVAWSGEWSGLQLPAELQDDGLYFLGEPPLAYLAAAFPPQARFLTLVTGFDMQADQTTRLVRRVKALLNADPPRPVRLVMAERLGDPARGVLGSYGLDFAGPCLSVPAHLRPLAVCPLIRGNPSGPALMPAEPGARYAFAHPTEPLPLLGEGWSAREDWGRWAVGADATLLFRLPAAQPGTPRLAIRIDGKGFITERHPASMVTVSIGTAIIAHWRFTASENRAVRVVCLPEAALGPDRAVRLRFHQDMPRSPASEGVSADTRSLNIGIYSLDFVPAEAADCAADPQ